MSGIIPKIENKFYQLGNAYQQFIDAAKSLFVLKSGDTMTGTLVVTVVPGITASGQPLDLKALTGGELIIGSISPSTGRVSINDANLIFPVNAPTASAPAYVKGGLYFDTTFNKNMIAGATVWELTKTLPGTATVITPGATPTLDASLNELYTLVPAQAETINATNVPTYGKRITIVITTSGVSSYVITFGTAFKSIGTLATGTTSGKVFTITFISDGTNLNEIARTTAM